MTKQEAIHRMQDEKQVSIPFVQKALKLSYDNAKKICDSVIIKKTNIYLDRINEYLNNL